jgi:hypothetical protein
MCNRAKNDPPPARLLPILGFALLCTGLFLSASAAAQSLLSRSSRCEHQPQPGTPLTHIDFTIPPNGAKHSLENPLRKGVRSPLVMLAFGDSAMWGNGLTASYKYANLVGKYVADKTGRTVELHTYAHSGALLANASDSCYEPIVPSDHGRAPEDLNAGLPSALQQETEAAAPYKDAELVLLDGCINDVSAEKIALPFPFSLETRNQVHEVTKRWCSNDMLTVLRKSLLDFPAATIIVSNYWLIISDKSKPYGLEIRKPVARFTPKERASIRDMDDLLRAELKAERLAGLPVTGSDAVANPRITLQHWWENSQEFLATSTACFDWAVSFVDGKVTGASDECPVDAPHVPKQVATKEVRTFLADVPDSPEYSYGAGRKKRVWSVPVPPFRQDLMYSKRSPICDKHYSDALNLFVCHVNPTAHPNVAGATAYQASITDILSTAWGIGTGP